MGYLKLMETEKTSTTNLMSIFLRRFSLKKYKSYNIHDVNMKLNWNILDIFGNYKLVKIFDPVIDLFV